MVQRKVEVARFSGTISNAMDRLSHKKTSKMLGNLMHKAEEETRWRQMINIIFLDNLFNYI